nr:plasmid replication protein RepC [Puniceibacterium antarcticum]
MSQTGFGQSAEVCTSADKWALLATLTEAAPDIGLNHRTLSVLKALLSFFPDRILPEDAGAAVVFPSNRSLSLRLNGMPESTLRRHLATLVTQGIVSRQDGPNRKRFARRYGIPYGFDLSPLARTAQSLRQAADSARERAAHLTALRDRLALLRARLLEDERLSPDHPLMEQIRLTLRRKAVETTLRNLIEHVEPLLSAPPPRPCDTAKMSGRDAQNERHIQSTNKNKSVNKAMPLELAQEETEIPLENVLRHCHEYKSYFPEATQSWHGVCSVSDQLHGMLGITRPLYMRAQAKLGIKATAAVILAMLERMPDIRKPAAYFQGLIQRFDEGCLNLNAMFGQQKGRKLSADNFWRR